MADMTNRELANRLNELEEKQKNGADVLGDVFASIEGRTSLDDLDLDTLNKFIGLIEGHRLTPSQTSILERIVSRQAELQKQQTSEQNTALPTEGPANDEQPNIEQPTQEQPANTESQPQTYLNSYNLARECAALKAALEANPDAPGSAELREKMDILGDYAKQQISESELTVENAPIIKDYVEIMTMLDDSYEYEHADELEQKLVEYDEMYHLTGEMPSAEEFNANEDKWKELTADIQNKWPTAEFKEHPYVQNLEILNPDMAAEVKEIIHTTALTKLGLQQPSANQQEALQHYNEVLTEISAQYLATIEETMKGYPASDDEAYLRDKAMRDLNLSPEELDDPKKKKAYDDYIEAQKGVFNLHLKDYLQQNNLTLEDWQKSTKDSPIRKGFARYNLTQVFGAANVSYTNGNMIYASRVARKIGMAQTPVAATELQRKMEKKHSKWMEIGRNVLKNGAISAGIGIVAGPIGLTFKQGIDLRKQFLTSWHKFANGKASLLSAKNWKNFSRYLKENPEERLMLRQKSMSFALSAAASAAIVATTGLTGGLGLAGGAAAGMAGTTAANAASATVMGVGVTKVKAALNGVVSAGFGWTRYAIANKASAQAKKELTEILSKYPKTPEWDRKTLFGKILQKTPEQKVIDDLANTKDETKILAKLKSYMPDISDEDKQAALALVMQIKETKSKARTAALSGGLGALGGLFVAEGGAQKVQELVGEHFGHGATNTAGGQYDVNKSLVENLKDNEYKPNTPFGQGEHTAETTGVADAGAANATLPADSFEKGGDMWYATQMGPTVMEEKLRAMGLGEAMDKLPRGSHRAIPSPVMADYLKSAKLTQNQAKELQDFVGNRRAFNAEVARMERINARNGYVPQRPHTHTNSGNTAAAAAKAAQAQAAPKPDLSQLKGAQLTQDPAQTQATQQIKPMEVVQGKTESGGWLKRIFGKKHEESFVMPAGLDTNAKAEVYAGYRAMADYNAKHPDAPITSPEEMKAHGYNVKGTVDGHKVHIKISDNGNTEDRSIDGVKTRIHQLKDANNSVVVTHKHNEVNGNMVGADSNQVNQSHGVKADKVLGTIKTNGNSRTYVQDGDTKRVYEVDQNGQVKPSNMSVSKAKSVLRNFGSTFRNGGDSR